MALQRGKYAVAKPGHRIPLAKPGHREIGANKRNGGAKSTLSEKRTRRRAPFKVRCSDWLRRRDAGRFSSETSRDDGLARDVLARVAVDDQLLDGRLVLRADGHEPVHDHIAHLAEIWGDMGRYGEI